MVMKYENQNYGSQEGKERQFSNSWGFILSDTTSLLQEYQQILRLAKGVRCTELGTAKIHMLKP